MLRAADVDRRRALGIVLGAVDVRPRGRMQRELNVTRGHEVGRRVADIPFVEIDGEGLRIELGQRAAELARCAGDQDAAA